MIADDLFAALTTASCGAYAVSVDQTIEFWNRVAERIIGHTSDEVLGRQCYDVMKGIAPGGLTAQCLQGCPSIRYLRAGLVPPSTRLRVLCSSGERKWIAVTPMVVAGLSGDAPLIIHLFGDVEAREGYEPAIASVRDTLVEGGADILSERPVSSPAPGESSPITKRELEVLRLMALGWETPAIADELEISRHTVRNHIHNLRKKLKAPTKLDAVVAGMRLGILSLE